MIKILLILILSIKLQAKEVNYQEQINYRVNEPNNKNIFIEYEQWKNMERSIQLSDEYRTYITPRQLEEFQKRLWIEYQEENMRHYIRMNEAQEYNSTRPDLIYIQNNEYYRRKPAPYYW